MSTQVEKYCGSCGTMRNEIVSSFCGACGASLLSESTLSPERTPSQPAIVSAPPIQVTTSSSSFTNAGIGLGILALFFIPILLGGIGILLSAIAKSRGEKNASTAFIVSIGGTIVGVIFGAAIGAATYGG